MDSKRVFIGVYKDTNQESLFYQKDNGLFRDLIKSRSVSIDELESNLIPYDSFYDNIIEHSSKAISYANRHDNIIKHKSKFRRTMIKLYNYDRMQKVSLKRTFIGNSYVITKILNRDFFGFSSFKTTYSSQKLGDKILLYSEGYDLEYSDFIGIENNEYYKDLFYPEKGDIYISIDDLKPASLELNIHDTVVEKQKLLEKYRTYKKGGNKWKEYLN